MSHFEKGIANLEHRNLNSERLEVSDGKSEPMRQQISVEGASMSDEHVIDWSAKYNINRIINAVT
jgi:hypothetical protein